MATIATLAVKLIADAGKFISEMDQAERKSQTWSQNVSKNLMDVGGKITHFGTMATTGLTLPIVGAGAAAIKMASDLEESTNAVNVMFGESANVIHDFGKTAATEVGLATAEFNQLASVTGAFLTNLGYDQAAAADETINLTRRASDMASTFNTDVATAMAAIQSGLKGEFNPLEQFGVKLNMAAINAKALQMGLVETTVDTTKLNGLMIDSEKVTEELRIATAWYGEDSLQAREKAQQLAEIQQKIEEVMAGSTDEITDNARAQAALALIYEQTNKIAGDFKNTSSGLANTTRQLKAELTNAGAAIGGMLLPYALKLANWARDMIAKFQALTPEQQKWIMIILGVAAALGPVLIIIGSLMTALGAIIPVVTAVAGALSGFALPILLIIGVLALLYAAWTNNWGGIQEKAAVFWAWLQPILQSLWDWLAVNVPLALEMLKGWWDIAITALANLWANVLQPAIAAVWANLNGTVFPFFAAFANFLGAVFGVVLTALAGIWENVLAPALQVVWSWLSEKLSPAFQWLADFWNGTGQPVVEKIAEWIGTKLTEAFGWLSEKIADVTDWLNGMADMLRNMSLPDWMTPGSPTPWEMGLRGVGAALDDLSRRQLPSFNAELGLSGEPSAISGGGGLVFASAGAGGGNVFNINVTSDGITDERDVARKIWSAVEVILRERGLA